MASKRRLRRNSCTGKQKHKTKTEAVSHAISYAKTFGTRVSPYHCSFCGGWHVGH